MMFHLSVVEMDHRARETGRVEVIPFDEMDTCGEELSPPPARDVPDRTKIVRRGKNFCGEGLSPPPARDAQDRIKTVQREKKTFRDLVRSLGPGLDESSGRIAKCIPV